MKMNGPKYLEAIYLKTNTISITSLPDDSMIITVQGKQQFTPYSFQLATGDSIDVSVNSPIYFATDSSFSGPNVRYTFNKWFNTANTSNTITIKSTNTAITQFLMQKSYMVQITTMPQKMGIVQQNLWFGADTAILLSAPSYSGFFFDHWEIENSDTIFKSPLSVTVKKPMHMKAVYDTFFTVHDMDSLLAGWQPILDKDGPKTLDGLVSYYQPDCEQFSGASDIQSFAENTRKSMISSMKINMNKPVLSDQIQRTFTDSAYSIEVHRLEVFSNLYLSVNVYLPVGKNYQDCPLIIMAPGCESDLSTDYMQYLAGNLATLGMVVVSADGFCSNGNRGNIDIKSSSPIAYARELIGLPCPVTVFTQELISTISWAISKYPIINPQKIGCTGYSHGGCMCLMISQIDKRISCVSIPATGVGSTCGNNLITSDIYLLANSCPETIWSAPTENALHPLNSEFALLFPAYVHSTCGDADPGANSANERPVYDYATQMYATAGLQNRISFNIDASDHNYNEDRRDDSYEWFTQVFNGTPIQQLNEIPIQMHSFDELEPDLSGTITLSSDFQTVMQSMKSARFDGTTPSSDVNLRVSNAMNQLFGDFKQDNFSSTLKISKTWNDLKISGYRLDGLCYSLPIVIFQNLKIKNGSQAIYLPNAGTSYETDTITSLLNRYGTVVSIDYFGIGEFKSDRVMLITYADNFMNNNPSLPEMIVNSLRSYLKTTNGKFDIVGNGWASSFFASCLQYLEPTIISNSILHGVPLDELGFLASGTTMIPDLLLWNNLFSKITVAEIEAANKSNTP
jgi:dienelactone hydrolase